jgi:hypothetical protein
MTFGIDKIADITQLGVSAGIGAVGGAGQTAANDAVSAKKTKNGAIAAEVMGGVGSVFAAAASANAIPVAGQFISAGLAIAGLLTKIFVGRKHKKKAAAKKKINDRQDKAAAATSAQSTQGGGMGLSQRGGSQMATAPVAPQIQPRFSSFGGGSAPSIQPTQQALNASLGIR